MGEKNNIDRERAKNVFFKLIQTDRMHRSVIENYVSKLGIHRSQHMMLMYLSRQKFCPSQKAIAQEFGISAAAVAVTLKKLESGGFIERNMSSGDNRFNEIMLTQKGKELTNKTKEMFSEVDTKMFSDFSDEECTLLEKLLEKMQTSLKNISEL